MGLQKYRADKAGEACPNGSVPWYTHWMGGPSLALVRNCPTPFGPRTVYMRSEPDTFFSIPAACYFRGKNVTGYVTCSEDEGGWTFHPHKRFMGEYARTYQSL